MEGLPFHNPFLDLLVRCKHCILDPGAYLQLLTNEVDFVCRDARVMDQALAMHDACLRAVLHQHYGYEVTHCLGTPATPLQYHSLEAASQLKHVAFRSPSVA